MKTDLKQKIVNLTNWIMLVTVILVGIWFYVFIITMTFKLKVFAENTTEFFFLFISAALSIVLCSVILNIGLNLSIIAESRKLKGAVKKNKFSLKKSLITAGTVLVLIPCLLFLGNHLSRVKLEHRFISEAEELITRYDRTITKISSYLSSPRDIARIPGLLQFLSEHKAEYPDIQLILPARYDGQQVFLKITRYTPEKDLNKPLFNNTFFACDEAVTKYLSSVFSGKEANTHFFKKNEDVYVFIPVKKGNRNFVLVFSRIQRYGKFGS
ncbi:MAG: hypothetical protein PHF84_07110 [bacterium]|nr:hypothetical protein [bacterium]